MGSLLSEVRSLFSARRPVIVIAGAKKEGDSIIKLDEPKMCEVTCIRDGDLVGHFLSAKGEEMTFPVSDCRMANLTEISAVVGRPRLLI